MDLGRRELTQMVVSSLGLKSKSTIYPSTDNMMFHCPFHKDKTPSLSCNFVTGQWHCFSCNRGGNIESLYREKTGRSIYKDLGINTEPFSMYARQTDYSYLEDFSLKTEKIEYDESKVVNPLYNFECASYLRKRGIVESVIKNSKLGYSESIKINGRDFKKRLLIPIYEDHKLISIEGRRIVDNDEPKVLYPKGSSVNTLYDIDNLDKHKPLYVVEGLMDCFVLRSCEEFKNSTSIFGASLTKRQLHLLQDFDEIYYINDLDDPGLRPLEKLKEIQRGQIFNLRLPPEINGVKIKDVGDLPKANVTPQYLVDRKWLKHTKLI